MVMMAIRRNGEAKLLPVDWMDCGWEPVRAAAERISWAALSAGPDETGSRDARCSRTEFPSDETLVDIAPSPRRSRREPGRDRMVGFLVVRPGVPVRRVIGTGHPAAGQADDESRRAAREALAVPAVI